MQCTYYKESVDTTKMALLRDLKLTDDPKGSIILHTATSNCLGNEKAHESVSRKCRPYQLYSSSIRAKISKYASYHDETAALIFFFRIIIIH